MSRNSTKSSIDWSRCYPVSSSLLLSSSQDVSTATATTTATKIGDRHRIPLTTKEDCLELAKKLIDLCLQNSSRKGSLYCGGLGPHVFLRYQLSKTLPPAAETKSGNSNNNNNISNSERTKLLTAARAAAEYAYVCCQQSPSFRVSLLEGRQIGSLCLLAAIDHRLGNIDSNYKTPNIISLLDSYTSQSQLPPGECEVLYGRAGAIQAILWLRREFQNATLGQELVIKLAIAILQEGQRHSNEQQQQQQQKHGRRTQADQDNNVKKLRLSWEWHGKTYLGAAHGIVGILQTLLSLEAQEWEIIQQEQNVPKALEMIQETIQALMGGDCSFESGNLKSSSTNSSNDKNEKSSSRGSKPDRLVHWCHGAPGLALLCLQAAVIFPNDKDSYIAYAKYIAENVIWPRGMLRKGVGLCHGISGNGMVLLRIAAAIDDDQKEEKIKWSHRALQYLNFAASHLEELQNIPDRPFSLFEGIGGLVCFLLQCATYFDDEQLTTTTNNNTLAAAVAAADRESLLRFPLFEY